MPTPRSRDKGTDGDYSSEDHRPTLTQALGIALLPSPRTSDTNGAGHHGDGGMDLRTAVAEIPPLPTPAVNDMGAAYNGQSNVTLTDATVRQPARWGEYEPAIRRWEAVTRPAPEPTKPNTKGSPKLSDEFDEWLMGYPAGWITDVPGVTWNEALKACGNGVVPQQGAAAIRWLLTMQAHLTTTAAPAVAEGDRAVSA